jgi:hypothetical protein
MMPIAARAQVGVIEPIGFLQTWEGASRYPDETSVVSGDVASKTDESWHGSAVRGVTPLISSSRITVIANQLGRIWMPWTFVPNAGSTTFSVGTVTLTSRLLGSPGDVSSEGITVIPGSDVLTLAASTQIPFGTSSVWEEAAEVRLISPGLVLRTLRTMETFAEQFSRSRSDPMVADALVAIDDLRRWLDKSQREVAELCHFSLRASRYWSSGKTKQTQRGTVRRLYEVHAFVGSLVSAIGRQRAREWLASRAEKGDIRLTVLSGDNGVPMLLREVGDFFFAEAPRPERPRPEASESAEEIASTEPYQERYTQERVQRPRRIFPAGE